MGWNKKHRTANNYIDGRFERAKTSLSAKKCNDRLVANVLLVAPRVNLDRGLGESRVGWIIYDNRQPLLVFGNCFYEHVTKFLMSFYLL